MDDTTRNELARKGWEIHRVVEEHYHLDPATRQDPEAWLDKQRLLLADMAVHLLQTAIQPGNIELEKLTNNLNAILTIADRFLPHAELKQATAKLYSER